MSQNDLKIGPKIKAFRRQLGLQANKLAQEINISPSYCLLYTSPSPRDRQKSRMPSSA